MATILSMPPGERDAADDVRLDAKKKHALRCDDRHIHALRRELRLAGLSLRDTASKTQCQMLVRILTYLGNRGLNTLEAVGLGFYRVATRVQELEAAGYTVATAREAVIGSEGLLHAGVVRYSLDARSVPMQLSLDLGDA